MWFRKNSKYLSLGLTLLGVVLASVIMNVIFSNLPGFFQVIRSLIKVLSPILFGVLFAYLMNPVMQFVETALYRLLRGRNRKKDGAQGASERGIRQFCHVVGVVVSLACLLLVIFLIIVLILPTIVENVSTIFTPDTIIGYYNKIQSWALRLLADNPAIETWAMSKLDDMYRFMEIRLAELDITAALLSVTTQIYSAVKGVLNVFLGLVVAVYMLLSKETFIAQSKKLLMALVSDEHYDRFLDIGRRTNKIFSGFVMGKIIDSMIIGVICYVGVSIMNLPYPMLISVIIGVTNVIPFFGPLIGAVPSAFLILLNNPLQCFIFIIFIIILQQFDGNILGPHILGDSVGLSSFWILVSITVFSGIFGFAGMVLGVPVFAVIYMLVSDFVERHLRAKDRPLNTEAYYGVRSVTDVLERAGQKAESAAQTAEEEVYEAEDDLEIEEFNFFDD